MGKLARMNQAQKLADEGKIVIFDFSAPACAVMKEQKVRDAVSMAIVTVVQSEYTQGLGRQDGQVWAAWQEVLLTEPDGKVEVTRKQVTWLRAIFAKDDLKVPAGLAQSREAVLDYLDELLTDEPVKGNG